MLDAGVPSDHVILARFRRGGFVAPDSYGQAVGDHGSMVASRIVFGDVAAGEESPVTPQATCRYYDALVATTKLTTRVWPLQFRRSLELPPMFEFST